MVFEFTTSNLAFGLSFFVCLFVKTFIGIFLKKIGSQI